MAVLLGMSASLAYILPIVFHQRGIKWWEARNIYHMMIFGSAGLFPLLIRSVLQAVVAVAMSLCLLTLYRWISGDNPISRFYSIMTRENTTPSERGLYTTITVVCLLVLMLISWSTPIFFTIGMFVMAFGDAMGEIVGRKEGKIQYKLTSKKTVAGSLSVLITAGFVVIGGLLLENLLTNYRIIYLVAIALLNTFIEAFSFKFFDNILMPYATVLLLKYPLLELW